MQHLDAHDISFVGEIDLVAMIEMNMNPCGRSDLLTDHVADFAGQSSEASAGFWAQRHLITVDFAEVNVEVCRRERYERGIM